MNHERFPAGENQSLSPSRQSDPRAQVRSRREARVWGIIPAAGVGSRIQPLAFSKELLPVGTRIDGQSERPRAVCEYLVDRMLYAGATRLCFVISPNKADILAYFGGELGGASICYALQSQPSGLCDALFTPLPFLAPDDEVLIGLPDTIWFPEDGFMALPERRFSLLLFPVEEPEFFDAVVFGPDWLVQEIQVKRQSAQSRWVWGAFRLPARTLAELHELWHERECADEYFGTLVNAFIARGGRVEAVPRGAQYVDVGTLNGYRHAVQVLARAREPQWKLKRA
jgi:glucose-1-phosphate thymidylyltransferase